MTAEPDLATRVDWWLWAVRLFKSRSLATDACRNGIVNVAGAVAKPARAVRVGDEITVRQGLVLRTLIVRGYPPSRVGAKLVPEYCEDRTSPAEWAKATEHRLADWLEREKGSGRPTKRDRRALDQLFR